MKQKRAVLFFPHNPVPVKSGAHQRFVEMLTACSRLGYEVHFFSSTLWSDNPWTAESKETLKKTLGVTVHCYEPTTADLEYRAEHKQRIAQPEIDDYFRTPPGFKSWFGETLESLAPEILMMTYVFWDSAVDHKRFAAIRRIIDTHEIATLQMPWEAELRKHRYFLERPLSLAAVEDAAISESFYDSVAIVPSAREFEIYDTYDIAITISQSEYEITKSRATKTRTVFLPMTFDTVKLANDYSGDAILPLGPNPLNSQGYYYFAKKILPSLRERVPDFNLNLTGGWGERLLGVPGVTLCGFVPSLTLLYQSAAFLLCPIFGGTGQQVKVVEAMAHRVPAVLPKAAALSSPVIHGENGLVAENSEHFTNLVEQLWRDRPLCRQLGSAAQETIGREYSTARLMASLSQLLE